MTKKTRKIVFVCTGNVFRSMSAMFAVRAALGPDSGIETASAGTNTDPGHPLRSDVRARIAHWRADASIHTPRQLTREIIDEADLVIAMSTDHQKTLKEVFNYHAPLFLEIADGNPEGLPDLPEVIPDYKKQPEASRIYVDAMIDLIFSKRHDFARNLPKFLPPQKPAPQPAP